MPKFIKKLNSFFDGLRARITKRSVILFSVLALVMIIPTVFAIYFAYFYEDNSFLSYNNISIELYDSEGTLLFSDEASKPDIGNYNDLKMFYELKTNSLPISEKPLAERTATYRLVYSEGDTTIDYTCHFSESAEESCLEDGNGAVYSIPAEAYSEFLLSAYSENVYASSIPPALFTGEEQEVLPREVTWSYRRDNGFTKSKNFKLATSVETYSISGAINLAFDKKPDLCNAEVYDLNGKQLYSGAPNGLSSLSFEIGETVRISMQASWKNTGLSLYHGSLKYDFYVLLTTQAKFEVSAAELNAGELLLLSVKNAQNTNKIKYAANLSAEGSYMRSQNFNSYAEKEIKAIDALYDFEPKFTNVGDVKLALIPIPLNIPDGIFAFTLSSGASSEEFSLKITSNPQEKYGSIGKTATEMGTVLTLGKFGEAVASVGAPRQDIIFYSSPFTSPEENDFNAGYSFGNRISSAIDNGQHIEFSALGNEYISASSGGQPVSVINTGTVVGTGYSASLGNYVTVEHGLGIRTWYCFLGDISVKNGDILKKGDIIGQSGNGYILSGNGFLLLCSLRDIPIDPNFIFGKTFLEMDNNE